MTGKIGIIQSIAWQSSFRLTISKQQDQTWDKYAADAKQAAGNSDADSQ